MKVSNQLLQLLSLFNNSWELSHKTLALDILNNEIRNIDNHPLREELISLNNGGAGSLPFFSNDKVVWCTLASNSTDLNKAIAQLRAWIIPSFGRVEREDGFKVPSSSQDDFQKAIFNNSPNSYFRWRCDLDKYELVEERLNDRHRLENYRPTRVMNTRTSLYELRCQYQIALALGDRSLAEKSIREIDFFELDSALNTQFMQIRIWGYFREFDRILQSPNLKFLLAQDALPLEISEYIKEAFSSLDTKEDKDEESVSDKDVIKDGPGWDDWFNILINLRDSIQASEWLDQKPAIHLKSLRQADIESYALNWENIYIDSNLMKQHKDLINVALVIFLGDFVREPEFPRPEFAKLYLAILYIWGDIKAGSGVGREEGHVLLELASALLKLNYQIDEVKSVIEDYWHARAVPSQLTFVLDAVELLSFQHPSREAPANLWIEAADLAKRNQEKLLESERVLWRDTGNKIGLDKETIQDYFPFSIEPSYEDPLEKAGLKKIAIVCMREPQARAAADVIRERTNAVVEIVSSKAAGNETTNALSCDLVLFVWLATTHAVFRAFDKYDRQRLCYVQGTGSSSIVRALERWILENIESK